MNFKKSWFYLFFVLVVFVLAGIYLDHHRGFDNNLFNSTPAPGQNSSASNPAGTKPDFKNYGTAPEFQGIDKWLNSDPLSMHALKGKVVLVDFWTYSCINCIRTLPHVTKWYDTYKDSGLVVVGVHTPEFAFEKDTKNVQDAIARFKINYPVAQDNEYATWNNYSNQYWPAEYLIDKTGNVVYVHFGEGNSDTTENAIRSLLGLDTQQLQNSSDNLGQVQSPEMYFGIDRLANLSPAQTPSTSLINYHLPETLQMNNFALEGGWAFSPQNATLSGSEGKIQLKFHSGKLYLVASSPQPALLKIVVDGVQQPTVTVQQAQLYTIFDSENYSDHTVQILITGQGFQAFTFTFG